MQQKQQLKSHKQIGVGVIYNEAGNILIDRRRAEGEMGGLWEFPGGKIEQNETVRDCIKREIREELGIEVAVKQCLSTIEHQYSKFKVTLFVYYCQHTKGEPQAIECEENRWVKVSELNQYNFCDANYQIIDLLQSSFEKS